MAEPTTNARAGWRPAEFAAAISLSRSKLYELPVEVKDLLARAFPNPGDHAKIIDKFREVASSDRLGIPVRLDGDEVHVTYRAAILVSQRTQAAVAT